MNSPPAQPSLPLTALHAWHAGLASAFASVRETDLMPRLAEALNALTPIESMLFILERKGQPPHLLYQQGIPAQYRKTLLDRYFARGYMLDPFCLAIDNGLAEGFYHLSEIAPDDFFNSEYYKTYYLKNGALEDSYYIVDLDAQRKISLSLYQGCSGTRFSCEQLQLLRAVQPLVRELILQFASTGGLDHVLDDDTDAPPPVGTLSQQIQAAFASFGSERLTEREREIAHLILRGHSVKSTARELEISPETVRMHRKNLYTKLEIGSQAELFSLFISWLSERPAPSAPLNATEPSANAH
jgi:DNA-binding CsgD family transcriptional regulator